MEISEQKYYTIPPLKEHVLKLRLSNIFMNDYRFFNIIYVTPRCLLNMMKHSLTSTNEICGVLLGHVDVDKHAYLLTDSYLYPVIGTESRIEVTIQAKIITQSRIDLLTKIGRCEDDVGWYHSHPNLHCFYSNTDVRQHLRNRIEKLGTAIGLVIDPINTIVSAHLNLGAYSVTDPEEAKKKPPPSDAEVRKYGTAANEYYQLDIHYYCSELDKVVLNDFITKSYGIALKSSPLTLSTQYLIDSIEKARKEIDSSEDKDPIQLDDQISLINKDRQVGLWIHRKKRIVFG